MSGGTYTLIKVEDLKVIREQLEARLNGFKMAYPSPIIVSQIQIIESLLERLPTP